MSEEHKKAKVAQEAAKETAPPAGATAPDAAAAARPSDEAPRDAATVAVPAEAFAQLTQRAGERDKLFERLQRAVADFDNLQKRVKRDRQTGEEAKARQFVKELLPVVDDMERLLSALGGQLSIDDVRTAVRLLYDKARGILTEWNVESIEAVGTQFDPALHEAVRFQETEAASDGVVVEETRHGYTMRGGVLRAAQVVVAKRPSVAATHAGPEGGAASPAASTEEE